MIELAVVLAVGSSLHQSQLIYNRPRAMLPVLGKPMVVRTMERLFRAGIHNYIVVIGEDEGAVAAYLNSQWLPNVNIEFVVHSLHTNLAKTLTNIAKSHPKPFLITTYNSFTHINFPERLLNHTKEYSDGLILTGATSTLSKSTNHVYARFEGERVIGISHKTPNESDAALMVANLAVCGAAFVDYLLHLTTNTGTLGKQLHDIFQLYIQTGKPTLAAETSWLLQVETDYDLLTLNRNHLDDGPDTHILSEFPSSVQIIPPVRIDPQVSIGQNARLGPRVYLEAGCSIGHHASLSDMMVLQNAIVPGGSNLSDMIVSTRGHTVDPNKH